MLENIAAASVIDFHNFVNCLMYEFGFIQAKEDMQKLGIFNSEDWLINVVDRTFVSVLTIRPAHAECDFY